MRGAHGPVLLRPCGHGQAGCCDKAGRSGQNPGKPRFHDCSITNHGMLCRYAGELYNDYMPPGATSGRFAAFPVEIRLKCDEETPDSTSRVPQDPSRARSSCYIHRAKMPHGWLGCFLAIGKGVWFEPATVRNGILATARNEGFRRGARSLPS